MVGVHFGARQILFIHLSARALYDEVPSLFTNGRPTTEGPHYSIKEVRV